MRLHHPLDEIFGGPSHVRILRSLLNLPAEWPVSGREVAGRSGLSHPTATRVLRELARQGLVRTTTSPGRDAHEFNHDHVLASHIRMLFSTEASLMGALVSQLRAELAAHAPAATHAFIFGSVASGSESPGSDLDVAVFCPGESLDETEAGLLEIDEGIGTRFGTRIHAIVRPGTPDEVGKGRTDLVWRRAVDEGIPVLGAAGAAGSFEDTSHDDG